MLVVDDRRLLIPDRPGNKRFDGMRNVLQNPHVGLIFLLPGVEETLRVESPWHCVDPGIELMRAEGAERIAIEDVDKYRLELENLARAIRGEEPPLLRREDALGQARTIEALYRSAEAGGGPVAL